MFRSKFRLLRSKPSLVGAKSRLFRGNPVVLRSIHSLCPSEQALFPSANLREGLNHATDRRNHLLVGSKSACGGAKCKLRRSKAAGFPSKTSRLLSDQSRFRSSARRFRGKESGFRRKQVKVRTNHQRGRSNHRRIPSNDLRFRSVPSRNASKQEGVRSKQLGFQSKQPRFLSTHARWPSKTSIFSSTGRRARCFICVAEAQPDENGLSSGRAHELDGLWRRRFNARW